MVSCALLFHQFYTDTALPDLSALHQYNISTRIFLNRVAPFFEAEKVPDYFVTLSSPNCGKDIGGKLALVDSFLKLDSESDWLIFMHDKKSPHLSTGEAWRKKLWTVIAPAFVKKAIPLLADPLVGMIGPESCAAAWPPKLQNEKLIPMLNELSETYKLAGNSFSFVMGTTFWIRASVIRNFFSVHTPLQIRSTLEKGNILDTSTPTITHTWERLFAKIVVSNGMSIRLL